MTVPGINGALSLPPGTEARTDKERAGLAFERMLLVQLTQQLAKTAQPDNESSSAATTAYLDLIPGAMADALVAGGGIGLAQSVFPEDPITTTAETGGGAEAPKA